MVWNRRISTAGILCSLLIVLLVGDSDASVSWRKFSYFKNFGGLNDNLSTTEIADSEATEIQNIIFDTGGAIRKRYGYISVPRYPNPTKVATGTTVVVNGLFFFKKDNGNKWIIALVNNDSRAHVMEKAYESDGTLSKGRFIDINNPNLSQTYTNNYQPDFCVAQDVMIFVDGSGGYPYKWDGGVATASAAILSVDADMASGKVVEYHKNQLFIGGSTVWPSRVFFSELDDIYSYTLTDFFDLETSDGTQIRAMVSAYDALYIFKDRSIWKLSGYERDSFQLQKMVDGIGTISNGSVRVVNNVIYFVTQQNDIAIYDGAYTVKFISRKIRDTIGGTEFSRVGNTIGLDFSSYRFMDEDYYVSTTKDGGSTNNEVLLFDTAFEAWSVFDGINANAWCVGEDDDGRNAMYFGDYSGYVYRYPSTGYYDGNVATSAISAFYQTKWFKYEDICLGDKYWRLLKTYCIAADDTFVNAECKADYEASGKVFVIDLESSQANWDVSYFDVALWGGEAVVVGRNEVEKGRTMFQIRYSNATVNQGFTILGWDTFIEPTDSI